MVISEDKLEELGRYVQDTILQTRLSEVRLMVLEVLKILGIEITVRERNK